MVVDAMFIAIGLGGLALAVWCLHKGFGRMGFWLALAGVTLWWVWNAAIGRLLPGLHTHDDWIDLVFSLEAYGIYAILSFAPPIAVTMVIWAITKRRLLWERKSEGNQVLGISKERCSVCQVAFTNHDDHLEETHMKLKRVQRWRTIAVIIALLYFIDRVVEVVANGI